MTDSPNRAAPKKWFAFVDTEQFVYLGEHESFHGAHDAAENENVPGGPFQGNSVWIFPEENLLSMVASANAAIAQANPEKPPQDNAFPVKGEQTQKFFCDPAAPNGGASNTYNPMTSIAALTPAEGQARALDALEK